MSKDSKIIDLFPGLVITEEIKRQIIECVRNYDDTKLRERLKPYETKVSADTMNTIVY